MLAAGLVAAAGCASDELVTANNNLKAENARLAQKVADYEKLAADLQKQLDAAKSDAMSAKISADEWKDKYIAAKAAVTTPEMQDIEKRLRDLAIILGGEYAGGVVRLSTDLFFDSGKATLKPAAEKALKDAAPKIKEILTGKGVMLRIDGHTDTDPIKKSAWKDNLELSLMRARAVELALMKDGVAPQLMFSAGFGEWHPITPNTSAVGKAKNRRVEFMIVPAANIAEPTPVAPAPAVEK
jgi:chemotaxis protein MotB